MPTPVIEIVDVSKEFQIPERPRNSLREQLFRAFRPHPHRTLRVLDSVSLTVERGEALVIMGRNGSGKSTLLKILCGIYPPGRGRVAVRAPLTPLLELGVGWNFELDAIDNILLISTCLGLSLKQARAAVDEILSFAGVAHVARLALKHYSTGMAQRLAYATAFSAVNEVLVVDEVFAVGDVGFRARCQERLREFHRKGHTLILVSHEPGFVGQFCTRGILLDQGRVVCDGSARETVEGYLRLGLEPEASRG